MTLLRPPRHPALYTHLLSSSPSGQGYDLHMDALTGCSNSVLLAIAQISALANWKDQELRKGTLSVRELVRRGDGIEQQLLRARMVGVQAQTSGTGGEGAKEEMLHPGLPNAAGVDFNHANNMDMARAEIPFPSDEMRKTVARIYRESAMLYLQTVVNEPIPGKRCPSCLTTKGLTDSLPRRCPRNQYLSRLDHQPLYPRYARD